MTTTSWNDFARICADVLQDRGEARAIAFDEARNRLVVGEPTGLVSFIHLGHARTEWNAASPGSKLRVLHRRFWSSVTHRETATREQLLKGLYPQIRDRAWFSALRRQAELELGPDEKAIDQVTFPHAVINDELSAHLVVDLPSSLTEVGHERLTAWGLSFSELFERATANLRAVSQAPWKEAIPGVFISPHHDMFDATRMVLSELFSSLPLKGKPIFIAPTQGIAFVTGEDDIEGLKQVSIWSEEALVEPRLHCAIAFRLNDEGQWKSWLPAKEHPAYVKLKLLELQTLAAAYSRQKDVLDALMESNGHQLIVATLRAFRVAAGDIFTACVWQEGIEALLPQTDRIDFVRTDETGVASSAKVWSTTFEVARKTVGSLMEPIGDIPERWRVMSFPTEEQLEQMSLEGKL